MKIVIIGSVAAGTSVAAKARRNDENCEIVIYEKDHHISYSSCGLPYYLGEEYISIDDLTPRDPDWFKKRFNIDISIHHEVIKIDNQNKTIIVKDLKSGKEFKDTYDKLVLATGAIPIKPEIKGIESENVFYFKNVSDALAIESYIEKHSVKSVAIIGAGFIGLELVENLHNIGLDVTLIETSNHVMPFLDSEMSLHIENYLIKRSISFYTNKKVKKIENNSTIVTDDNTVIDADVVVMCTGVKPNINIAQETGLKIGSTGAIKVNKQFETSDSDIFAVGDCAESYSLITNKPIYRPLGSTANKMGRIAGDVLTGGDLSFRGILGTGIVKLFDLAIGFTGLTEKEAINNGYDVEVIHNIKEDKSKYLKESKQIIIKAVCDKKSKKLLGVQIIGEAGVDKRLDVFATAISLGATVDDLFHLDLAYAPPFSTTKDPVMYTGMVLNNALERNRKIITAHKLIKNRDEYTIIDVRSDKDFNKGHIKGAVNIPLKTLRNELNKLEKNKKIVVHCNKGVSGNAAQNILINYGFKQVYNLSGGYKQYIIEENNI